MLKLVSALNIFYSLSNTDIILVFLLIPKFKDHYKQIKNIFI